MHDKTYEMQPFKTSNLNNFMNYKNEIIICEIIFIKFEFLTDWYRVIWIGDYTISYFGI